MSHITRKRFLATLLAGTAALPATLCLAERPRRNGEDEKGKIDWNRGVLYATGLGAISKKETNDAKAYLRARSFARLDARRNLLAVISHVKIDSRTVGQDYEAVSDTIREEISGLIKGSEIISERKIRMGNSAMVEVTVSMPIYGDEGIASVFLPEVARRNRKSAPEPEPPIEEPRHEARERDEEEERPEQTPRELEPEPAPEPAPLRRPAPPREIETPSRFGGYTSLIVDARGTGIERCMSPKIRYRNGEEVWGTVRVDPDYVIDHGIVGYVHSLEEARRNARSGDNPLILKAVDGFGKRFETDVVLSDSDARRLLQLNRKSGFLDKFRVLFIVDPGK